MDEREQTLRRMELENAVQAAREAGLDADEITETVEAAREETATFDEAFGSEG